MTATIQPGRVIVLTDAAIYDWRDGVLQGLMRKCFPIPGAGHAVFATRGHPAGAMLFEACCAARDIGGWDDFLTNHLKVVLADYLERLHAGPVLAHVLMAGWSAALGVGEVLFWTPFDFMWSGKIYKASTLYIWRGPEPAHVNFAAGGYDLMGDPATFEPVTNGVGAFAVARQCVVDLSVGRAEQPVMGRSVGGWVDAATITATGVTHERLITWPEDQPGRPIAGAA